MEEGEGEEEERAEVKDGVWPGRVDRLGFQ